MHYNWNAALSKLPRAALAAYALCAISHSVAIAAEAEKEKYPAAQWRTGNLLVNESAANANGWLTLTCEGKGCVALLNAIESRLPADERRRVDGLLQVRAVPWHTDRLTHYGPFRAEEGTGGLMAAQSPWLDARYTAAECGWQDDAGRHRIELAGGPAVDYAGPDGLTRRLDLERGQACSRCRGQDTIRHYWRDPGKPGAGTLVLIWKFSAADNTQLGGYASWPNQQPARMICTLR
jgi:hypothetical protein